jgi:hypothetical protein
VQGLLVEELLVDYVQLEFKFLNLGILLLDVVLGS